MEFAKSNWQCSGPFYERFEDFIHTDENVTRIIYARPIFTHSSLSNWMEAILSVVLISYYSNFYSWSVIDNVQKIVFEYFRFPITIRYGLRGAVGTSGLCPENKQSCFWFTNQLVKIFDYFHFRDLSMLFMKKQQTLIFPILKRKSRLHLSIRPNLYRLLNFRKIYWIQLIFCKDGKFSLKSIHDFFSSCYAFFWCPSKYNS